MKPTLSVIIPIYNVEDYLERCVKSVLNQDYRDLEVILVDDGSPDRCPQICDELAKTDERIKVIHKPNGGLSSARNAGIKVATGEYLAFLDSDDQWAEGKLSDIMIQLHESDVDMIMFRSLSLYPDGTMMQRNDDGVFKDGSQSYSSLELYKILVDSGNFHEQAGTHFLRAEFIKTSQLYFKEGLLGEDTEWMFRVMRIIKKVVVSNTALQIYSEKRPGSITNTNSVKSLHDLIEIIQGNIDYYVENKEVNTRKYELAQCAYLWSIALGYYSLLPHKEAESYKLLLKEQYKQLNLKFHPKSRLVGRVYPFLGFALTSKLLKLYMNLHGKNLVNAKKKIDG